jgi:hypothetical protein
MSSFAASPRDHPEPHGKGWRRLDPPVTVRGYIANGWHDAVAVDINDETREIRVEWPPRAPGGPIELITHKVLTPDLYQDLAGLPT